MQFTCKTILVETTVLVEYEGLTIFSTKPVGCCTGIYFEVTQHQEFITSFWNVGENGHSNSTALGLP